MCMCGMQDVITKGKVNETVCMFYGMIRTAGREIAIKNIQSLKKEIIGMISNVKKKDTS